ncbi:hypothetical protein F0562_029344 [Nyssa sinensis]|uniref:CW-type domain-containing protein n=1 Tax=Nyssa sinensis TaxID=561372 RepID=A0A5J5B3T5_9ASTE|nr:hypothetical protein F0562_029344 [Nyssa sinensis]
MERLEEGETSPFQDDDQNFDPDIAFPYIDERIQDVLGDYQKDFEGGISTESLGPKFGGYGSFLSADWRSDISSHPKTRQNVMIHGIPRPPHNPPSEGACQNSTALSSETLPLSGPDSNSALPLPLSRISSMDSSAQFWSAGECVPRQEAVGKSSNPSNQKTLKFRIKVGSENKLAQKNAEIYSSLGLNMSPSSSPLGSPAVCEMNFVESPDTLGDSPSYIIKTMTSCPVPDGVMLSPLEDRLVCFMEEDNCLNSNRPGPAQESHAVLVNDFASIEGTRDLLGEKETNLWDRNGRLFEKMNENNEDPVKVVNSHPETEIDIDNSMGKEVVSSALKLQIISNRKSEAGDVAKGTGKASKEKMGVAKYRVAPSNLGKEGALESVSDKPGSWIHKGNAKTGFVEKVKKDKEAGHNLINDDGAKDDNSCNLSEGIYDIPKRMKDFDARKGGPGRPKFGQETTCHIQDGKKAPNGMQKPSSEGKKKLKGSQSSGRSAADIPMESLRVGSSAAPQVKKTCGSYFPTKSEGSDMILNKNLMKVRDSDSNLIRKTKQGKKENRMDLVETALKDRVKYSKLEDADKGTNALSSNLEKRSGGKNTGFPSSFEAHLKGDLNDTKSTKNGPNSNVFSAEVVPVVIQENWVCCDKCHKWRLLPYDTNPAHLPKKWVCSMLNWLPGMNKCSFSEEETTNTLNELYQIPIPDIKNNQLSFPGAASGVTLANTQSLEQIPQDVGFNFAPSGGKSKHGLKAVSGDARTLKLKSKREADQDGFITHNKAKRDMDVVQNPGGLLTKQTKIDNQKYNEYSSSCYSEGATKDSSVASPKNPKNLVQKTVAMEEHSNSDFVRRKRKLKDDQESQIYSETLPSKHQEEKKAGESKYHEDAHNTSEENGRQDRKDEATGIVLSSNRSYPVDGNIVYEEGKSIQNGQPLGQYYVKKLSQWTVNDKNCLRKDLGSGNPSIATTSSSSKVSGTYKIKVRFQKVKDSPVESVSSSPLRISNTDNLSKGLLRKDDATKSNLSLLNSPRKSSEGKGDGGSDQSGTVRKEQFIHRRPKPSLSDYVNEIEAKDHCNNKQSSHNHLDGSLPQKSGKGSSSRAREKHFTSNSNSGSGGIKISGLSVEQKDLYPKKRTKHEVEKESHDCAPYKDEISSGKFKTKGNYVIKSEKVEKGNVGRKFSAGRHPNSIRGCQSRNEEHEDPHAESDTITKTLGRQGDFTGEFQDQNGAMAAKQLGKAGTWNELHQASFQQRTSNVLGPNDIEVPSPIKNDTSSHAANNALEEAKDLKHSANRLMHALKISGSGLESTKLFFQAALKFLHGASLLEPCNGDSAKHGEMTLVEVYGTTAKLCEYCAHEYERCKDMASAAVAYKCMEVSYMRLVYSNDFIASRDCHELQMALQMVPSVESPSSSASDVDNLSHQEMVNKMDIAKDVSLLQVSGNHVITARDQPCFVRLLNSVQDVNCAMEASRKCQNAFAAASVTLANAGNNGSISSIKRVLDYSFHDVEGLLHLVHHAMETLSS